MNFLCLASAFLLFQMGLGSWIGCSVKAVGGVLFVIGLRELRDVCNIQSKGAANAGGELPVKGTGYLLLGRFVQGVMQSQQANKKLGFNAVRKAMIDLLVNNAVISAVLLAVSAGMFALFTLTGTKGMVLNILSVVLGTLCTLITLRIFDGTLGFILGNESNMWLETDEQGNVKKNTDTLHFCYNKLGVLRLRSAFERVALCTAVTVISDILNRLLPFESAQSLFGFLAVISRLTLYILLMTLVSCFNNVRKDANSKMDDMFRKQNRKMYHGE